MIRALWFIIKVSLLVAVAVWVANRPGFITFDWLGYHVRAQMGLALLALFLFVLFTLLVYRLILGLAAFPRMLRRFKTERRRAKGFSALTLGLTAVAAGDARQADYHAGRVRKFMPDDKGLSLLLEGQAARLRGDDVAARAAFQALLLNKETAFLGLRGLLVSAFEACDYEEARTLTREALALHPRQPWLLRMAYDLDLREGRWDAAHRLLNRLEKLKAIDEARAQADRAVLLLQQAEDCEGRGDDGQALKLLRQAHKADPALVPAAQRLAQAYLDHKNRAKAVKVLEQSWQAQPHPDLVPLWRKAAPKQAARDSTVRLKWFERLAELKADSADGQMAVATEALEQGLYGVAEQHLDRAEGLAPSARLYRLRARVAQSRNRPEEASLLLKKVADAPEDKVWYCQETGRVYAHWLPVSPQGLFNTIVWGIPQHRVTDKAIADRSALLITAP